MANSSGINKVFLVGHIGKEPRWHFINSQRYLCFPLVTTEYLKKYDGLTEHAEWHQIKVPENVVTEHNEFNKDMLVYIQGRVQTRMITEDGIKRYKAEIFALQVQILTNAVLPENYVANK